MQTIELEIDITGAADIGEAAHIAVTITLPSPEQLPAVPVICFAKPGAGFSRAYYTTDLPGPGRGAQASWHAERGWIFVALDHLGVGESSQHDEPLLDFSTVARASHHAEQQLLDKLARGTCAPDFPAISRPVTLGLGQSMGGALTVVQAGRFHAYNGIAVLGYSAFHTHPPVPPGETPLVAAWRGFDSGSPDRNVLLNRSEFYPAFAAENGRNPGPRDVLSRKSRATTNWHFYREDTIASVENLGGDELPEWFSSTKPGLVAQILTPGIIAPEAAAVNVPVLLAMGDRDVVVDPRGEARSYLSSAAIDLYICPNMGHMHNFASTRKLFWQRIAAWGNFVAEANQAS